MALDEGLHGTTELRVHGVSGTPPEAVLQMPPSWVRLVRGTVLSGFYRSWSPDGTTTRAESGAQRVEAYCWGGLTSRSATRSLWLLVLPFTLVDVAHWMLPLLPAEASARRRRAAAASLSLLRLLSISITLAGVVAFALVTMDLTGWQCAAAPQCAEAHSYVGWLTRFGRPEQRVAAMALIPALLLVLVWLIGRSEVGQGSAPSPIVAKGDDLPLENPRFFEPDPAVLRLSRLHVSAASCLLAVLVLIPVARYADNDTWPTALLIALAALGSIAVLATCSQGIAGRGGKNARWADPVTAAGQIAAVIGLVAALATAFLVHTSGHPDVSHLPGLRGIIIGLFGVQLALIPLFLGTVALQHPDRGVRDGALVLLVVTVFAASIMLEWGIRHLGTNTSDRDIHVPHGIYVSLLLVGACFAWVVTRARRHSPRPITFLTPTSTDGPDGVPPAAAGGLGAPLVATLAWIYSLALASGVGLQVAQLLGHPVVSTTVAATGDHAYAAALDAGDIKTLRSLGDTPLIVPPGYIWSAVGALAVGLIAIALAAYTAFRTLPRRRTTASVESRIDYPAADRARLAAKDRALATLTDDAGVLTGIFVSATLVVGFVLLVGYLHYGQSFDRTGLSVLSGIGSWFVVAFVGGLLSLGYASMRNRGMRRNVGVLWDVCTFWPRASHPFTPPPYTECAVPALVERINTLTAHDSDRVVLSAHSQGSVIAVPVALRLDAAHVDRVRLLLHGCPVARLYARWFPAYFCNELFIELRDRYPNRWRTLYRRTDYIGAWSITRDPERAAAYLIGTPRLVPDHQVDQEVPDPPLDGGPARRHTDYWLEPIYTATVARLLSITPSTANATIDLDQGTSHPTASMSDR